MLQCVAVCCSVLQCAAVCCSMLKCVAVCCSVLQWVNYSNMSPCMGFISICCFDKHARTHWCACHDPFICAHVCAFLCAPWYIRVHSKSELQSCVTLLTHISDMPPSYAWHDTSIGVTWRMYMWHCATRLSQTHVWQWIIDSSVFALRFLLSQIISQYRYSITTDSLYLNLKAGIGGTNCSSRTTILSTFAMIIRSANSCDNSRKSVRERGNDNARTWLNYPHLLSTFVMII